MAPYFFFSYAHSEDRVYFDRFYDDLCREVAEITALAPAEVGFRDVSGIGLGRPWRTELIDALGTCECFVPLVAPRLLASPYCGQEWQAFQERLKAAPSPAAGRPARLLPVLWRPLNDESPGVIRNSQYLHESLGVEYAHGGLLKLLKNNKFKDQYEEFLSAFAKMMVDAVRSAPLPPLQGRLDIDSVPNAFESASVSIPPSAPRPVTADHVMLVVAAGAESELMHVRQKVSSYGPSWLQWSPFPEPSTETAVVVAQSVLAGEKLSSTPLRFDEVAVDRLTDVLEMERTTCGGIFVILLDPWSIGVLPYGASMRWFDQRRSLGGAVLEVWPPDAETAAHQDDLRARVRAAIPALSATGSSTALFNVVADQEKFGRELVKIVTSIQGRILETWKDPRIVGGKRATLPQLQGPVAG
jgi:FxsC-like protein